MKRDFVNTLFGAILSTCLIFSLLVYKVQVEAAAVTLTATVASSLSFTTSSDQFGTVTPGTIAHATTTLDVATNNTPGWNITLSGDSQSPTDTVMDLSTDASIGITDQAEWVNGAATTTAGNAVVRASLDNSGKVLAFRVMTASSTNGTAFLAPTWFGTTDVDGTAKWAGIASSTVARQIGNAGTGSYSSSNHINTVQYLLDVPTTQQTGSYDGALTYTATAN